MGYVASVNIGLPSPIRRKSGFTGIDKRPVEYAVAVAAPGPKGTAGSGLAGDTVCDLTHHGGDDQAVYAFAREDLDWWERELGRSLSCGVFGENLTTLDVAINDARIGECWAIGPELTLQVTCPRIPCGTFAAWMHEQGWVRRFSERAAPGTYLRVLTSGRVAAGDEIRVQARPAHSVTVRDVFLALTSERDRLPMLAAAGDHLTAELAARVGAHDARRA